MNNIQDPGVSKEILQLYSHPEKRNIHFQQSVCISAVLGVRSSEAASTEYLFCNQLEPLFFIRSSRWEKKLVIFICVYWNIVCETSKDHKLLQLLNYVSIKLDFMDKSRYFQTSVLTVNLCISPWKQKYNSVVLNEFLVVIFTVFFTMVFT